MIVLASPMLQVILRFKIFFKKILIDSLAGHVPRLPRDGDLPDDVGQDGDEANAQVGRRKVADEEVHPGWNDGSLMQTCFRV